MTITDAINIVYEEGSGPFWVDMFALSESASIEGNTIDECLASLATAVTSSMFWQLESRAYYPRFIELLRQSLDGVGSLSPAIYHDAIRSLSESTAAMAQERHARARETPDYWRDRTDRLLAAVLRHPDSAAILSDVKGDTE